MKTLSGTFAFVVLAIIAIVTLPSCSPKRVAKDCLPDDRQFVLKFRGKTATEYADVTKTDFDQALRTLAAADHKGQYDIKFLPKPGGTAIYPYHPPTDLSIKTDKVTTSEVAQNAPPEGSAAYDPNAVYHVRSNIKEDVMNVLKTFKEPSPTPTATP
jgi:hypothetical protein